MPVFNRYFLWPLLFLGHLLAVSLLSWHLLAQVNFLYPVGYDWLAIDEHIQYYGPKNRFKDDFAQTTQAEHQQLFSEISHAVQNHGQGLAAIHYRLPDGRLTPFMHDAEVIHLQDVANVIDAFYLVGMTAATIWVFLFAFAYYYQYHFPSVKKILLGFSGALTVLAVCFFIIGPEKVFYWLHELVFPDEHQWFFFYQDSLMTTLMKAPDLFAFIGLLLVCCFAVLWAGSVWGMNKLLKHQGSTATPQ